MAGKDPEDSPSEPCWELGNTDSQHPAGQSVAEETSILDTYNFPPRSSMQTPRKSVAALKSKRFGEALQPLAVGFWGGQSLYFKAGGQQFWSTREWL